MNISLQTGTRLCRTGMRNPAVEPVTRDQLRESVARLADLACDLDVLKNDLPSPQRDELALTIAKTHQVAEYFDELHGFGLYAMGDA